MRKINSQKCNPHFRRFMFNNSFSYKTALLAENIKKQTNIMRDANNA